MIYLSILGLIVEYNPFHNGHLYHFNTSLDITQAEYSICVISGNFVQRGEPAIVDKWARTSMALHAGIDLVIELPVIYCVQSAEFFAYGAVSLLNSLGIIDTICFGSETGDIDKLKKIGSIISSEPSSYKKHIRQEIKAGNSFASSRAKAVYNYLKENHASDVDLDDILTLLQSSNNILALEYLKWLIRLNSNISPVTIERLHSKYNDESMDTTLASATAIRKAIKSQKYDTLYGHIPYYSFDILRKQFEYGKGPVFLEDFCQTILCSLRRMELEEISKIMDVNEGLENRIKKAAISRGTLEQLIEGIKSKRYTETRIKRILIHCLLGMYKNDLMLFGREGGPQYVRVLGFSDKGRKLLSMLKNSCTLPVITNVSDYRKYDNPYLNRMIEFDIRSTDIYVTSYSNADLRAGGYDFYRKPETI